MDRRERIGSLTLTANGGSQGPLSLPAKRPSKTPLKRLNFLDQSMPWAARASRWKTGDSERERERGERESEERGENL